MQTFNGDKSKMWQCIDGIVKDIKLEKEQPNPDEFVVHYKKLANAPTVEYFLPALQDEAIQFLQVYDETFNHVNKTTENEIINSNFTGAEVESAINSLKK